MEPVDTAPASAPPAVRGPVEGRWEPRFQGLHDVFAENFAVRGEVGAAVCVYQGGRPVADLWGGFKDANRTAPWSEDTIVTMHSVGKSMATLCVLRLADRGQIELEAPVARYWPGFAQGGKAAITVDQLLGGLAGLVFLDHAAPGVYYDREAMVEAIERQEPAWTPPRGAYHSATYGRLVDELVRRVDGRPVQQFLEDEIAGPLGADFHAILSEVDLLRVADVITNPSNTTSNAVSTGAGALGRAWRILPPGGMQYNNIALRRIAAPAAATAMRAGWPVSMGRWPTAVSWTGSGCCPRP